MKIDEILASELQIQKKQVQATIQLIDEGNTIPFIARYRKEVTGALNDEVLRSLYERLMYLRNLEDKKAQVLSTIEEQGKLTAELKAQIEQAKTLVEVDDLYRPYRPKRRTRATIAKEKGLDGLAEFILKQESDTKVIDEAGNYLSEEHEVLTGEDAIAGAKDIIAEQIADEAMYRTYIRDYTLRAGTLVALAKDKEQESVYEMYYDF